VVEVALYPFALALVLFCVWRASTRPTWRWVETVTLAATLALLTYTYSIGRLLGPLFALGLLLFFSRTRARGLLLTLGAYAATLVPILFVLRSHPEALTGRFKMISYLRPETTTYQVVREFLRRYPANLNPLRLFVIEQSKVNEFVHLPGAPAM